MHHASRAALLLALILGFAGCGTRSITASLWTRTPDASVIILESHLDDEGKAALGRLLGKNVVYDQDRQAYVIKVGDPQAWEKVTMRVLATPFTVAADGVQFTVVAVVHVTAAMSPMLLQVLTSAAIDHAVR